MDSAEGNNISCPVCTLYLRPGITLKNHLGSHPKQKVIEALVRLADQTTDVDTGATRIAQKSRSTEPSSTITSSQMVPRATSPAPPHFSPSNFMPANMFFYQQSQNMLPTVLNGPPMMPFMYQQQVFMSSGPCMPPMRTLQYNTESPAIVDLCEEERKSQTLHHVKIIDMDSDDEPARESRNITPAPAELTTATIVEHLEEAAQTDSWLEEAVDQPEMILGAESNVQDFLQVDGVRIVINDIQDLSGAQQLISHVGPFEDEEQNGDETVLLTLDGPCTTKDTEESLSMESPNVNIRADERLPPRGELSGQESVSGTSDSWSRLHYENSSSFDGNLRANWEDSSDVDVPPLQSRVPVCYDDDQPSIVGFSGPPRNFKCPSCDEAFSGLKARRQHEAEVHRKQNTIGSEIGKKAVKKLVIKLKKEPEAEAVDFKNKLKVEEVIIDETKVKTDGSQSVCIKCGTVCDSLKALREHRQSEHPTTSTRINKCTTCNETFSNGYKFAEHLRIHPLECNICGRLFYRRQNMQLHMRRHLGIKPYKCDVCQKGFITKQKLTEHCNIHTGEAPLKCNLCHETFRRHSNLVQHRNRHHMRLKRKIKDYICACGDIFHSKKKLAWHMETHESKPKSCTYCSEKFIHAASLTRHMRKAHNHAFLPEDSSAKNAECPICKGVFLKTSLEVHMRSHNGQRPFCCLICNKDFTTKWNLKLHKYTHASRLMKPFKCDLCKGAFLREAEYTAHMNSHKNIKPYTCNYCGAKFIRKYNCLRHVKEHESDKMYTCSTCGKSFHRSYYLKDHMRIHGGLRPFSCNICGKSSTTKSNHNKHLQIHHAREPVSTEN